MKKLYLAALVATLSATNLFAAFDGKIGLLGGTYQNGQGGEFNATTSGAGLGNFVTFCIEHGENIVLNNNMMDFKINDGAVAGGAGTTLPNDTYTGLSKDRISWGTAWLYSQFRAETLDGGNYFGANRYDNAGALQNAIWFLEGEIGDVGSGAYYLGLATTAAGLAGKTVTGDSAGAFGVIVLNLFNGDAAQLKTGDGTGTGGNTWNVNQDMLGIVPEPTTVVAGALLLLPLAASTIRILRKNRV